MGIRDIVDAYNEKAPGPVKCFSASMDYIEGGKKEKFTLGMTDGSKIILIVDCLRSPQDIAELALKEADGRQCPQP